MIERKFITIILFLVLFANQDRGMTNYINIFSHLWQRNNVNRTRININESNKNIQSKSNKNIQSKSNKKTSDKRTKQGFCIVYLPLEDLLNLRKETLENQMGNKYLVKQYNAFALGSLDIKQYYGNTSNMTKRKKLITKIIWREDVKSSYKEPTMKIPLPPPKKRNT